MHISNPHINLYMLLIPLKYVANTLLRVVSLMITLPFLSILNKTNPPTYI